MSNNFDFEQKELGVLRAFIKQNKYKIIVVGSFALYLIKNKNNNIKLSLKFNDLDIDLYKSIREIKSKSLLSDKKREEKISIKVNQHFYQVIQELSNYNNVSKVEVWLSDNVLEERDGNDGTYGGKLLFNIFDDSNSETPHPVYVDINFESKKFDVEMDKIDIDGLTYNVSTYVYEKMLADKYLAFVKHYGYSYDAIIKRVADVYDNRPGFKDKVGGNIKKLWKDIYDILFIKSMREIDTDKVKKYILMMNKRELNLNAIDEFINEIKNEHPNITKSRNDYDDISSLVTKCYWNIYNKIR